MNTTQTQDKNEPSVRINVNEHTRPKCLYLLKFNYKARGQIAMEGVLKDVKEHVDSKLRELWAEMRKPGRDVSDYSIDVGITFYVYDEDFNTTFAEGIVTVELKAPFGQYAVIVADREGY